MKIAYFMAHLNTGGAERVTAVLASTLAKQSEWSDFVLVQKKGENLQYVDPSINLVDLRQKRTVTSALALRKYLISRRPDVLLSALSHANVTALLANKFAGSRSRVVVVEHSNLRQKTAKATNPIDKMMPKLISRTYRSAHVVAAVSKGVAEDLAEFIPSLNGRVKVLYNPVVTPELLRERLIRPDHPWFAENAPPVVLSAGRLSTEKDFENLVHAMAQVPKELGARLLILGEGPERSRLEKLLKEQSYEWQLPGRSDQVYRYMGFSRVYALSSIREGLPGSLIEALACNLPVVSTNCPSGPEEILQGRFGTLVPMSDPRALAEGISEELSSERKQIPAEAWEPYTVEKTSAAYWKAMSA